jgi:hypothetical protein
MTPEVMNLIWTFVIPIVALIVIDRIDRKNMDILEAQEYDEFDITQEIEEIKATTEALKSSLHVQPTYEEMVDEVMSQPLGEEFVKTLDIDAAVKKLAI